MKIVREFVQPENVHKKRYKYYSLTDKFIQLKVYNMENDPNDTLIYHREYFLPHQIKGVKDFFRTIVDNAIVDFSKSPKKHAKFELIPKDIYFHKGRKQRFKENAHVTFEITNITGKVELSFEDWRKLRFEIDELFILQGIIP